MTQLAAEASQTTKHQVVVLSEAEMRDGYVRCMAILQEHGKTFYVMARLLGPTRGDAIAAIYGFARTADDTVDAKASSDEDATIQAMLEEMRRELKKAVTGSSTRAEYAVLGETIRKYGIELYPFEDLLLGVGTDLNEVRFKDFSELELYCYRVAGTIGLMITPVAGYQKQSNALEYAKTLGTAFQLTNILRDVGDDLARGRLYLPETELKQFGLTGAEIFEKREALANDPRFRSFMDFQIDRAFSIYRDGLQLIPLVTSFIGRVAFRFAVDAYSEIMNEIRKNEYDVFTKRAHLTGFQKLRMIPRSVFRVLLSR